MSRTTPWTAGRPPSDPAAAGLAPEHGAVQADQLHLDDWWRAAARDLFPAIENAAVEVRMHVLDAILAQEIPRPLAAKDRDCRRVDEDEFAIAVDDDRVGAHFNQLSVSLLALAQRLLRPLAFGYVEYCPVYP